MPSAPSVPPSVAIWQLQSWLATQPSLIAGHTGTMLSDANAVAAAAGPPVSLWWQALSAQALRSDPGVANFAAQIGLTTSAQVDAMFIGAAAVVL